VVFISSRKEYREERYYSMKKYIYIIISFIFFINFFFNCSAAKKGEYKVQGLTDEVYYALSGAWDSCKDCQTDAYQFSWGKGKWVSNSSLIIDFGADPPQFYEGGFAIWEILSVEVLDKGIYRLNLKGTWFHMESKENIEGEGYIIIHAENDTIRFEDTPHAPIESERIFYKVSGPKRY
jgi:hypothetical protein